LGLRGDGWLPGRERWEETVRANLTATFLTARAFLREVDGLDKGGIDVERIGGFKPRDPCDGTGFIRFIAFTVLVS
jgi:NAD(P)-dependent dehydrogenase (short-subunit alcohol dehydrogenase family)